MPFFMKQESKEAKPEINSIRTTSSSGTIFTDSSNTEPLLKSPWTSMLICAGIYFLAYVQFSIYFSSMWPYLSALDPKVNFHFFGFITATYSFGQAIASPVWGFWCQKARSSRHQLSLGIVFMITGNVIYALLPAIANPDAVKWVMLAARFITGAGSGIIGCCRAYCAVACAPQDRTKAVTLVFGAGAFGMAVGPAVQAVFLPFGTAMPHAKLFVMNVYTTPAWAMIICSALAIIPLQLCFKEHYAGIIPRKEEKQEKQENDDVGDKSVASTMTVLPKFDRIGAAVCIYLWVVDMTVYTGTEVMLSPLTIALYNWKASQAVLYGGILQAVQSAFTCTQYWVIAYTRIGKFDNRKLVLFGMLLFSLYHIISIPWPFYNGPLDNIRLAPNTTVESTDYSGGCSRRFHWCSSTTRVPMPLFFFGFTIVVGAAFGYVASPTGNLYATVLGPRNQNTMQGIFAFFGSMARCVTPLLSTALFEAFGYLPIMLFELCLLIVAMLMIVIFYRRLVPLQLRPPIGKETSYKHGVFVRF